MANKAVIVLGMHRSGTSAVTRVLNLLGVDLGASLLPPAPDNPTGYWEHKDVMEINEHLFWVLGRHWTCSLTPLPENWWLFDEVLSHRQKLVEVMQRDFSGRALWAIKDPRLCRLLPMWHTIFEELNWEPRFLHITRHPLEVANSLKQRDGLSRNVSLLIWFLHVVEAEKQTRGHPRVFITFDQVLDDWQATVDRVSGALDLEWPIPFQHAAPSINLFLNRKMKHHSAARHPVDSDYEMPLSVAAAYQALANAAAGKDEGMEATLDTLYGELEAVLANSFGNMIADDLEDLTWRASSREKELAIHKSMLDEVVQSRSWRMTAPLRKLYSLLMAAKLR